MFLKDRLWAGDTLNQKRVGRHNKDELVDWLTVEENTARRKLR